MNKEVLIICHSIYRGNTRKLASAMARKINCRSVTVEEAISNDLQRYQYIGLGSGIYFTAHHPKIFELLTFLNSEQRVFLFSTHGAPFLGKYHVALKTALENQKISVLGEFSCRGYDCTGPFIIIGGGNKGKPNEFDLRRAERFIGKLLPQYSSAADKTANGEHIKIRFDDCTGCGKCIKICPLNVYKMENQKPFVNCEDDCIHCNLCRDCCPVHAISIQHSWKEAIGIAKRNAKKRSL